MRNMTYDFKFACALSLAGVALVGGDAVYEHFASARNQVVSSAHASEPAPLTAKQINAYCTKILPSSVESQTYQPLAGRPQRSFDFCVKSLKARAALRQ